MNHRSDFITWYFNEFVHDPHFKVMQAVSEASPWHREENTAIHTNMVVAQYIARADHQSWVDGDFAMEAHTRGRQFLLGAFAAAFHDVGKPHSMQFKMSEERGEYKSFNGHEKESARMWEDWAVRNWGMLKERFGFTSGEVFTVGWMIENHLPWGLKRKEKRKSLALTVARLGIQYAFPTLLMADTTGRISDDADTKIQNSQDWCAEFNQLVVSTGLEYFGNEHVMGERPQIVMPIAPSGAGKSTLFMRSYQNDNFVHFSLDEERLLFAGENNDYFGMETPEIYRHAWQYCTDNVAEFRKYWQAKFVDIVKHRHNVFVDNTNLSKKARNFFLTHAQGRDYWSTAILFPVSEQEVINRQTHRGDKEVPEKNVRQMYRALQTPWYGDFDEIIVREIK